MKSSIGGLLISTLMITPAVARTITVPGISKDDSYEILKSDNEVENLRNMQFHFYYEMDIEKGKKFCFLSEDRKQCFVIDSTFKVDGNNTTYKVIEFIRNENDSGDIKLSITDGNCLSWSNKVIQCTIKYRTPSGRIYYNTVDFKSTI